MALQTPVSGGIFPEYPLQLNTELHSKLKKKLQTFGFSFHEVQNAFFQAKKGKLSLTFFHSGKLLLQGEGFDEFIE
ncbi:DUF3378 domain-containing protein, partial [Candidatus Altiarchaeota archaeon]